MIAGRGPLLDLIELLPGRFPGLVTYVGLLKPDEMPACYAPCDVFMIPQSACGPAEAFLPMKLLEAMAMARVVLVSNAESMMDVVRDGDNGLVFEKSDPDKVWLSNRAGGALG